PRPEERFRGRCLKQWRKGPRSRQCGQAESREKFQGRFQERWRAPSCFPIRARCPASHRLRDGAAPLEKFRQFLFPWISGSVPENDEREVGCLHAGPATAATESE